MAGEPFIDTDRATDEAAKIILEEIRWDGEVACPRCGSPCVGKIKTRALFRCMSCRKQFTRLSGTVFGSAKLSHSQILEAMLFIEANENRRGMKAALARHIGVTWKTAHVLCIRVAEDNISSLGRLKEPSVVAVGYWQGFNFWTIQDGHLVRQNKRGETRVVR